MDGKKDEKDGGKDRKEGRKEGWIEGRKKGLYWILQSRNRK
jgi:hypothetical protein